MAHDLTLSHKIKTLTRKGKGEAIKGKIKQYVADVVSPAIHMRNPECSIVISTKSTVLTYYYSLKILKFKYTSVLRI